MTITSFFSTVSLLSYVHVHVSVSHKLVTVKYTCLDEINLHTPLKPISYDGGVSLPYMDFPLRHVCVVIQNPLPLAASPVKSTNICVHKHVIILFDTYMYYVHVHVHVHVSNLDIYIVHVVLSRGFPGAE